MLQARRRRKFGKLYVLLLQIVRSFSVCTEKIDYFSGGLHKNSDSTCKDTSIKHLKIEIEYSWAKSVIQNIDLINIDFMISM